MLFQAAAAADVDSICRVPFTAYVFADEFAVIVLGSDESGVQNAVQIVVSAHLLIVLRSQLKLVLHGKVGSENPYRVLDLA